MNTGLYTGMSNEELVEVFRATGDNDAFTALMESTEGIRTSLAKKFSNIPNSEMEDLLQEGATQMIETIKKYDSSSNTKFTSFLYADLSRKYLSLYKMANAECRSLYSSVSADYLQSNEAVEEDGNSAGSIFLSVECDEYSYIEICSLIENLKLSDRERMVANLLCAGKEKAEIAVAMGVAAPTVHKYVSRIGKKMILSGLAV